MGVMEYWRKTITELFRVFKMIDLHHLNSEFAQLHHPSKSCYREGIQTPDNSPRSVLRPKLQHSSAPTLRQLVSGGANFL